MRKLEKSMECLCALSNLPVVSTSVSLSGEKKRERIRFGSVACAIWLPQIYQIAT